MNRHVAKECKLPSEPCYFNVLTLMPSLWWRMVPRTEVQAAELFEFMDRVGQKIYQETNGWEGSIWSRAFCFAVLRVKGVVKYLDICLDELGI